jgi:hypothetical protein
MVHHQDQALRLPSMRWFSRESGTSVDAGIDPQEENGKFTKLYALPLARTDSSVNGMSSPETPQGRTVDAATATNTQFVS